MSTPTTNTPGRRLSQLEMLEYLVKKYNYQFGDRKIEIKEMVTRLRTRRFIGPKQVDPIWETIFEARFAYFMAKFAENGVPEEKFLAWQRDMAGKKHGQIFYEAGKLLDEYKKPRKQHGTTHPVKKELKYPCTCGKRERFVVKATGKVLPLCPVCHKAGKNEPRVPARLAAPSADVHAKDLGKAMEEKPVVVAAKIAYKRTVTSVDRDLSEKRFQEAKNRFRHEGRKTRHTGKTARKNGKISLRRALELA